ncbi:putative signal transducing protein [Microbulbifer sp. PAAF003]|uniref:putative signal transducing protein n=1 Tax=Microbulbifer sp. PAAF003 TaxID=3243375 RepID=UPI004039C3CC
MLVTVARFSFPYEAQIAKARLESEGIHAFIADEHTVNMQWLYSNAMGGIRLQVSERDLDEANKILNQDRSILVDQELGHDEERVCESCSSRNVEPFTKGKKPAFLVFLLLGMPLFFYQHGVKCKDCGHFQKLDNQRS